MKVGDTVAQGDIILMRVEPPPMDGDNKRGERRDIIQPASPGKNVIALGEATGHMHYVPTEDATMFNAMIMPGAGNWQRGMYVEVKKPTQLKHGGLDGSFDHNPIDLEPGFYRVIRQREYAREAPRVVGD